MCHPSRQTQESEGDFSRQLKSCRVFTDKTTLCFPKSKNYAHFLEEVMPMLKLMTESTWQITSVITRAKIQHLFTRQPAICKYKSCLWWSGNHCAIKSLVQEHHLPWCLTHQWESYYVRIVCWLLFNHSWPAKSWKCTLSQLFSNHWMNSYP